MPFCANIYIYVTCIYIYTYICCLAQKKGRCLYLNSCIVNRDLYEKLMHLLMDVISTKRCISFCIKHKNHSNNNPVIDSKVLAYLNPNWPGSVYVYVCINIYIQFNQLQKQKTWHVASYSRHSPSMPCKFLLVLFVRLEPGCRRFTFSGQNLSSSRSTSVTKKAIKNSTGMIITSCSYTRISEGADHMLARNMSEMFEIAAYNFGDIVI